MNAKFAQYLERNKIFVKPITFPSSTRTAQEAADSVGCEVGRIAKSLAFWAGDEPLLAIVSGRNRVDLRKLEKFLGQKIRMMSGKEVKKNLSYAIGGVPPFGYLRQPRTVIDQDLFEFDTVYAAAGVPDSVFPIAPRDLKKFSSGLVLNLKDA